MSPALGGDGLPVSTHKRAETGFRRGQLAGRANLFPWFSASVLAPAHACRKLTIQPLPGGRRRSRGFVGRREKRRQQAGSVIIGYSDSSIHESWESSALASGGGARP